MIPKTKKIKKIFSIITAILCSLNLSAQQNQAVKLESIVLPSPEVTALQRYGNWPMGSFTGTPNISIPLFNISSGKLKLPISLVYNSGGVKTNDVGSNVGVGWVINAGGQINRNMMGGQTDEEPTVGYWHNYPVTTSSDVYAEKGKMDLYAQGRYDAQPDVFTYSAGGLSGKFVFDALQNVSFLPYTNLSLQKTLSTLTNSLTGFGVSGAITSFTITDENGTTYQFSDCDFSQTEPTTVADNGSGVPTQSSPDVFSSLSKQCVFTWNLSSIISADKKDTIKFQYDVADMTYTICGGSSLSVAKQTDGNHSQILPHWLKSTTTLRNTVRSKRLRKIIFNSGYLEFFESTGREDILSGGQLLDSIVLHRSDGSKIKSFGFDYLYLKDTTWYTRGHTPGGSAIHQTRLFLNSVNEISTDSTVLTHLFTYENSKPLPSKILDGGDIWGYANGKSYGGIGDSLSTYYFDNFDQSLDALKLLKASDFNYAKQGILTNIKYPTGGSTTFEYEPHYKELRTTSISKWTCEGNINIDFTGVDFNPGTPGDPDAPEPHKFTVSSTASVDVTVSLDANYNNFPSYYYVEIRDSASNAVKYSYYNTSLYCDSYTSSPYPVCVKHLSLTPGTYYILAKNTGQTYSGTYSDISCHLNISSFNCHYENVVTNDSVSVGGIRIKNATDFDPVTGKKVARVYEYGDGIKPSEFNGLYLTQSDYYYLDAITTYGDESDSYETEKILTSNSTYPLIDVGSSYICYGNVTEKQVDLATNKTNGYTKNYYDNDIDDGPNETDYNFIPYPPYVAQNWKRGKLLKTEQYKIKDNTTSLVRAEQNSFSELVQKSKVYGRAFFTKYHMLPHSDEFVLSPTQHEFLAQNFTVNQLFNYTSSYDVLDSTSVSTYDDNGNVNTVKTVYSYDSTTLLARTISVSNSKGEVVKTSIKRPFDYKNVSATDAVSQGVKTLQQNYMLSPEIELSSYRLNPDGTNQRLTSSVFTSYNTQTPVKDKIYTLENSRPLTDFTESSVQSGTINMDSRYKPRIQFNRYNLLNKLTEQQKIGDVKEVYLWGYKSEYPVAKIMGSNYDSVQSYINQSILDNPTSDLALRMELNKIRTSLSATRALVTTYTYAPLVGMTSQTDPKGMTTYYNYDAFSRLKTIRDKDSNIVKRYEYHYASGVDSNSTVFTASVLTTVLNNYRQIDSGSATTTLIDYNHNFFPDTRQTFSNGIAQLPEAYRGGPPVFYNAIEVKLQSGTFCFTQDGYSIEFRVKMPTVTYDNSKNVYFITTGPELAIFTDLYGTGIDGVNLYGFRDVSGNAYGAHYGSNGFGYILADPTHGFNNYQNIRLKVTRSRYYVYYNNTLVKDFVRDSAVAIAPISGGSLAYIGNAGSFDWFKLYDKDDNLKYVENFDTPTAPTMPDPSLLCPQPSNCQTRFTNYFNQAMGTAFTFAQINSLYLEKTGQLLNICN